MHEFAIARALIDVADREARRMGSAGVHSLHCRIGALRQVDNTLLQDAFQSARLETLCECSRLVVEKVEMTALCPTCKVRFPLKDWHWNCPVCHEEGRDIEGGDELELISIDVISDAATV